MVTIAADDVTITGFTIRNSGNSLDREHAGIFARGKRATPGFQIGELMPNMATRLDRFSIVRSFQTGDGNHDIKPIVSRHSINANIGSLYSRIAGYVDKYRYNIGDRVKAGDVMELGIEGLGTQRQDVTEDR